MYEFDENIPLVFFPCKFFKLKEKADSTVNLSRILASRNFRLNIYSSRLSASLGSMIRQRIFVQEVK
jgi:hypothetical protein